MTDITTKELFELAKFHFDSLPEYEDRDESEWEYREWEELTPVEQAEEAEATRLLLGELERRGWTPPDKFPVFDPKPWIDAFHRDLNIRVGRGMSISDVIGDDDKLIYERYMPTADDSTPFDFHHGEARCSFAKADTLKPYLETITDILNDVMQDLGIPEWVIPTDPFDEVRPLRQDELDPLTERTRWDRWEDVPEGTVVEARDTVRYKKVYGRIHTIWSNGRAEVSAWDNSSDFDQHKAPFTRWTENEGPWSKWEDVPDDVTYVSEARKNGPQWVNRDGERFIVLRNSGESRPSDCKDIAKRAPFVRYEEA